jgi:hypothetical protein
MAFVADAFESIVDVVEAVVDSVTYLVTGNYEGDNGDNTFTAVGLGLWGGGVNVYGGNDTVYLRL